MVLKKNDPVPGKGGPAGTDYPRPTKLLSGLVMDHDSHQRKVSTLQAI